MQRGDRAGAPERGGPTRLEALYHDVLPVLYGFCRARLPEHDAEDVTADVFRAAAELLARDPDRTLHRSWFITTARNLIIDRWRRDARWSERLATAAVDLHPRPDDGPGDLGADGGRDGVLAALDRLPVAQRAAAVLRWVEGRSVREVAEVLGRSEHATESLLARARRGLQSGTEVSA